MDYYFLVAKITGLFIMAFHLAFYLEKRQPSDLFLVACIAAAGPAFTATDKIRNTKWYIASGMLV